MKVIFADSALEAAAQVGLNLGQEPEPGRMMRFSPDGRNRKKSGWMRIFPDGDGAVFGNWPDGTTYTWQRRRKGPPPDATELAMMRERWEAARKAAEAKREEDYAKAALIAQATVRASTPAAPNHSYLRRKGVATHGLLQRDNALVAPVSDERGNLQSVQCIFESGDKRFLPGGRKHGGRFWLGDPKTSDTLLLAEGFATAASVREATGLPVAVTFDAGNLKPVALSVREQFPKARIALAADDDRHRDHNIGREKATEAARLVNGYVVLPKFDGDEGSDWNDLHAQQGLDAVREQIMAALDPEQSEQPIDDQRAEAMAEDHVEAAPEDPQPTALAFLQPALAAADVRDGTTRTRPLTEYGNTLRLLDRHRECVRFVPEVSAWLVWRDGWTWDPDGADVRTAAAALPQAIYAEGIGHKVNDAEHFARWARQSQAMRTVQAVVHMLSDQRSVRLPMTQVDADPMLVGCNDARSVIDLRTGKSRPAAPGDFITKSLSVPELGDAKKATRWLAFLEQIFDGDVELIDWIHRWMGYVLTGSTSEQLLVFCYGLGANGKSVLGEMLRWLIGDYARAIPVEMLCESRRQAGGATPDLADLVGARLALTTETEDGAALAESLIKSLTAGDTISARPLYGKPFNFRPQFKLILLGNHRPVVRGTDNGIWRRIRLVPFSRSFGPSERDPQLLDKLKGEAPHILAWMVDGCLEWQRRGLADTPRVIAAETANYQIEQDVIGQWLSEETTRDPMGEVSSGDLYSSYRAWAIESGLKPASKVSLGRRMGERGYRSRRSNGHTKWFGLRLKPRDNTPFSGGYGQ